MTYDLVFGQYGMQAVSMPGYRFMERILQRRPLFPPLDYREAIQNGLQVSFTDKDALGVADVDITDVTPVDPGSTSAEWKPIPSEIDVDEENCGMEDDSPDSILCDEETERSGM